MLIHGWYYDAQSSARERAELRFDSDGSVSLSVVSRSLPPMVFVLGEWQVSDRVANTPRFIRFSNSGRFESLENELVDAQLNALQAAGLLKQSPVARWANFLEQNKFAILTTLICSLVIVFCFVRYGVPYGARLVANNTPEAIVRSVGSGTLQVLDDVVFRPSKLSEERRSQLSGYFSSLSTPEALSQVANQVGVPDFFQVEIVFRDSEELGANAFALPDGKVVFTDALVELANNDKELAAIYLHEIGHVYQRHAMRRLVQQSGLAIAVALLTGDVNAASQLAITLPTLMLDAHYSREMEREADEFAYFAMTDLGIELHYFSDILRSLQSVHESGDEGGDNHYFLQTHPYVEERVHKFDQG